MTFSVIIPVFNRPLEVRSLLESLYLQTDRKFEVIIVEDGSWDTCENEVKAYRSKLDINYIYQENSGPGNTRNAGCRIALGDYFIFLDSDCVLPPHYMSIVKDRLSKHYTDAFGGPDEAMKDFTRLQRAINYSMTSFFTTGGIRGSSEKLDKFHPRSFNMGYSREVFNHTEGFSSMRFGEDIDMSIRIIQAGFTTRLVREAYVYHRRRTTLWGFFKQVYNSGIARIHLFKKHPHSLKAVHFAPAVFTSGVLILSMLSLLVSPYFLILLFLHALIIFADATYRNKHPTIGLLSVGASYVQLLGYGIGFLHAFILRMLLGKGEFSAFQRSFYK
ncbi:glycosyltransferase [Parapedobacter koreensis]|uniref:Glycosyltransferase, catalytic subunit of cellulose synthase and poly-beta-1,6-N-acetylglucosamine synthase n=1 Tax=Parapedobacter koreensis TaxID=332977 RepID=A0A1H7LJ21_9SPHI|nr:glycosyltransferase [Parapedobacter koreensis]SEK98910.1 Glycosyltransferase, catalytic subunit of cellulose synthase and poly-beta-1,6-N-acetylglucosamine synthase [Parapedobacter koreensis]